MTQRRNRRTTESSWLESQDDQTNPGTGRWFAAWFAWQPWGSADASVEAAAYLDDLTQNRLELDAEWNLRLFRGMELEVGANIEHIHDQMSIPKRDATDDEILLERRALATDYRFDVRVGFSYTFGSIFSQVVNPRFGSGPGQILR